MTVPEPGARLLTELNEFGLVEDSDLVKRRAQLLLTRDHRTPHDDFLPMLRIQVLELLLALVRGRSRRACQAPDVFKIFGDNYAAVHRTTLVLFLRARRHRSGKGYPKPLAPHFYN